MNDSQPMPASFRTSGTNLTRARSHNHRVVLEIIRTRGPVGRTEISEITSLSRQTVQNIVGELESRGVVEMQAQEARGRGHPGMMVRLRPDHAFSLGFHVDRLSVTAIACDLHGQVVWQSGGSLDASTTAATNSRILSQAEEFRCAEPDLARRLFGAGLAAPGPFNLADAAGKEIDVTAFTEFGSPANLGRLQEALRLPVVLQNDASAAALGEHVYGLGRSYNSFAFIQFGMGLGAGFVLNGSLYSGASRNAGEIGHVMINPDGPPCSCGNRGCLERYLSINALCEKLGLEPTAHTSVGRIEALFEAGDPDVLGWIDAVAPLTRQMINMVDMMLDPEAIILGGIIRPDFLQAILDRAAPLSGRLDGTPQSDRIHIGTSGATAVALGATAAAVDALYAPSVSHLLL